MALIAGLLLQLSGCVKNLISDVDRSDPAIKARMEAAFNEDKSLDLRYITIDVHSRIATVSGMVNTQQERSSILRIANSIAGVDQLVINVVVQE